jgi:hypothetical protein
MDFSQIGNVSVYLESTKQEHGHGGEGWEFGSCLWSPARRADGGKYYEIMRSPAVGDVIFHNYRVQPPGNGVPAAERLIYTTTTWAL